MLTRRSLLALAAALPAMHAARADGAATALDFVRKLAAELVAVVDGGGTAADKRAAIERLLDRDVDTAGVARFCLGRFWRLASPQQQRDYTALFREVLVRNITGKLGEYAGVTVTVERAQARAEGIVVSSTIVRPNNAPNRVDWIVSLESGGPKVIDVVAEGTSLRLTQRSDYTSFLSSHNNDIQALIDALRAQAKALASG
jgi:phospholipid transport system substrate-binding protein